MPAAFVSRLRTKLVKAPQTSATLVQPPTLLFLSDLSDAQDMDDVSIDAWLTMLGIFTIKTAVSSGIVEISFPNEDARSQLQALLDVTL